MTDAPAGAVKPQDHKDPEPKVEKCEVTLTDGDTVPALRSVVKGVTVTVPVEAFDDYELTDALAAANSGDPRHTLRYFEVLHRLFDDTGDYQRVINELKGDRRRLPTEEGGTFAAEVYAQLAPNALGS